MGEGKRRCRRTSQDKGAGGVHKGHFHIQGGMVVRGERKHSICQPALHVTEKHFFLVKRAVTHLALGIIREGTSRGGGERVCGPGRG